MFPFKQELVSDKQFLFTDTLQVSDVWCLELTTLDHVSNSSDAEAHDPISGFQPLYDTRDNICVDIGSSEIPASIVFSTDDPILEEPDPIVPAANRRSTRIKGTPLWMKDFVSHK